VFVHSTAPLHTSLSTLPVVYGYSYAVSGVKTKPRRYIAAGRLLLSRPVRARAAVLRTHFLFEVNHVEVYNNIKFPFTRFVGSALFLRQKTHSLHPTSAAAASCIYLLSRVTSTATFFFTECVWFRFFSFSFLVRLIISTSSFCPSPPPPTILLNDSSGFVGTTVHYLCCVCTHLYTTTTLGNAYATHPQVTATISIYNLSRSSARRGPPLRPTQAFNWISHAEQLKTATSIQFSIPRTNCRVYICHGLYKFIINAFRSVLNSQTTQKLPTSPSRRLLYNNKFIVITTLLVLCCVWQWSYASVTYFQH